MSASKINLQQVPLRPSSTSPLKKRRIPYLRQSTASTAESQSSIADITEKIYCNEVNETKARILEDPENKRHTEELETRLKQKDRHIRRVVDYDANYAKPKLKSRNASFSPNQSTLSGSRRNWSSERVSTAKVNLSKGVSFSSSPVKPNLYPYQDYSPSKVSFSVHNFEIFPQTVKPYPVRPVSTSRTGSRRITTDRLFMLNAIQCACDSMGSVEDTEKQLEKGLNDLRKIKNSIEWTSKALNKIDCTEADLMAFQYDYMRHDRDTQLSEKSVVSKEFRKSSLDPNRPIAKIERSLRRTRGRMQ
mmetsp:Transcript_27281/g.49025  ORF Transcript_27281/g.49025 Transcript_27281/m.49025 type:complete len:304 (+) Transcript_27281:2000-2911(+)